MICLWPFKSSMIASLLSFISIRFSSLSEWPRRFRFSGRGFFISGSCTLKRCFQQKNGVIEEFST